jgi:serine/threonine protein kinase
MMAREVRTMASGDPAGGTEGSEGLEIPASPESPDSTESSDARFDALVESFLLALRRGESPPIEEYQRSHPDLAERIGLVFPTLDILEGDRAAGQATDARVFAPGARLDGYRLLREVGRGGMGVVYEAEEEALERRVALKVLLAERGLEPRSLERFRREARAAARLEHPGIVPIYAVGEAGGVPYYAMEYGV